MNTAGSLTNETPITATNITTARLLVAASVAGALVAEALIRSRDFPGATFLPALGLLFIAWWIALHGAVSRASGVPATWFTLALPVAAGVFLLLGEIATAIEWKTPAGVLSGISMILLLAVPIVTLVASYRARRKWKAGLVAWSLLAAYTAILLGGLSGMPLGIFGTESRTDELMFLMAFPPLIALLVAGVVAPGLLVARRVATIILVVLGVFAGIQANSDGGVMVLLAIAAVGGVIVLLDMIGRNSRALPSVRERSITER